MLQHLAQLDQFDMLKNTAYMYSHMAIQASYAQFICSNSDVHSSIAMSI
jgi:hypothetical protein